MLHYLRRISDRIAGRKSRLACPECHGTDFFKFSGEKRVDKPQVREVIKACNLCKGKGYLTAENQSWIKKGRLLKEYRTRQGMSQSEFAHRYGGLRTAELDAIEKGYRNPTGFIGFLNERGISIDSPSRAKA